MTKQQLNQSIRLTDLPNAYVDMESEYFFVSSSGNDDNARLELLAIQIFSQWEDGDLHYLDKLCSKYGIELWSAPEVELTKTSEKQPFACWLRFTQQLKGNALLQCELISQERVH